MKRNKTNVTAPATKATKATKAKAPAKEVKAPKTKEVKRNFLCLTGSGESCRKEFGFSGLGRDAAYKSRLLNIATGNEPADLPTKEQLAKLGYEADRIKLVPHKGMTSTQATAIIADRQWLSHLEKRKAKLERKNGKADTTTKTKPTKKAKK